MSPRKKWHTSDASDEPEAPEVVAAPVKVPEPDEPVVAEFERNCPRCHCSEVTWWPRTPNIGEGCIRKCRACGFSKFLVRAT